MTVSATAVPQDVPQDRYAIARVGRRYAVIDRMRLSTVAKGTLEECKRYRKAATLQLDLPGIDTRILCRSVP